MARTLTTLLMAAVLLFQFVNAGAAPEQKNQPNLKLAFLENKGQITDQFRNQRSDVDFKLNAGSGLNIFIGSGSIHYQWASSKKGSDMYRMDVTLLGANLDATIIKEQKQNYSSRFLLSHANATAYSYGRVTYKNVYPNIDWVFYINELGKLEHDFVVHPGGKISDIRLQYGGSTSLAISDNGSLIATTPMGIITEDAPYAYKQQSKKQVSANYVLENNILSFDAGRYAGTLVIDPTVEWATYFGGLGRDCGRAIKIDKDGSIFMAGETESIENIATTGAYQTEYAGGVGDWGYASDAFIAKFDAEGELLWASYFGGDNDDVAVGLAIDTAGNIFMSGWTLSSGIATTGSHQEELAGEDDAFVAKFDTDGELIWSTYYGGEMYDNLFGGGSLYCDGSNLYLAGTTMSETGIATEGAWQETAAGSYEAFIAKFDNEGILQWGSYLGSAGADRGRFISGSGDSVLYLLGFTNSTSGIASTGAYQEIFGGGANDAFVARFDGEGNLVWSTYFGGEGYDKAEAGMCSGSYFYLSGVTESTTAIATEGSHQESKGTGEDVFLTQFSMDGSVNWSTYYGGDGHDRINASASLGSDLLGNIYFAGQTASNSDIVFGEPFQEDNGGGFDAFVAKFNSTGEQVWGSYFGGIGVSDFGNAIATSGTGMVYVAGITNSATAIATESAYQTSLGGGEDVFLLAINDCVIPAAADTVTGATLICSGVEQIYSVNQIADAVSYTWVLPEGWSGESTDTAITVTASTNSGLLKVIANGLCAGSDTFSLMINVSAIPVLNPSGDTGICSGSMLDIEVLDPIGSTSYSWIKDGTLIAGETGTAISIDDAGNYQVIAEHASCIDTSSWLTVTDNPLPTPVITRSGMLLSTTETYSAYQWNFEGTPIVGATGATHTVTFEGNYTVTVTDENGCQGTSDIPTDIGKRYLLNEFALYPNPAMNEFIIVSPIEALLNIYSTDGRMVIPALCIKPGNNTVDISDMAAGIYWLRITDNARSYTLPQQLVKVK